MRPYSSPVLTGSLMYVTIAIALYFNVKYSTIGTVDHGGVKGMVENLCRPVDAQSGLFSILFSSLGHLFTF